MVLARPDAVADVPAPHQTAGHKKCVDRPIKNTWATSEAPALPRGPFMCRPSKAHVARLPPIWGLCPQPPTSQGAAAQGGAGAPHPSRRLGPGWLPAVGNGRGAKGALYRLHLLVVPIREGPASVAAAAAFPWCITARTSGHGAPFSGPVRPPRVLIWRVSSSA